MIFSKCRTMCGLVIATIVCAASAHAQSGIGMYAGLPYKKITEFREEGSGELRAFRPYLSWGPKVQLGLPGPLVLHLDALASPSGLRTGEADLRVTSMVQVQAGRSFWGVGLSRAVGPSVPSRHAVALSSGRQWRVGSFVLAPEVRFLVGTHERPLATPTSVLRSARSHAQFLMSFSYIQRGQQ